MTWATGTRVRVKDGVCMDAGRYAGMDGVVVRDSGSSPYVLVQLDGGICTQEGITDIPFTDDELEALEEDA